MVDSAGIPARSTSTSGRQPAAANGVPHRHLVGGQQRLDDLIALSREEAVGLLVIGLRKRTPVGKLVLGSNSQQMLLRADCKVLAVKAGPAVDGPQS